MNRYVNCLTQFGFEMRLVVLFAQMVKTFKASLRIGIGDQTTRIHTVLQACNQHNLRVGLEDSQSKLQSQLQSDKEANKEIRVPHDLAQALSHASRPYQIFVLSFNTQPDTGITRQNLRITRGRMKRNYKSINYVLWVPEHASRKVPILLSYPTRKEYEEIEP